MVTGTLAMLKLRGQKYLFAKNLERNPTCTKTLGSWALPRTPLGERTVLLRSLADG